MIVSDILAARAELVERGVDIKEVRHLESREWVPGPDPERADYASFATSATPMATALSCRRSDKASREHDGFDAAAAAQTQGESPTKRAGDLGGTEQERPDFAHDGWVEDFNRPNAVFDQSGTSLIGQIPPFTHPGSLRLCGVKAIGEKNRPLPSRERTPDGSKCSSRHVMLEEEVEVGTQSP